MAALFYLVYSLVCFWLFRRLWALRRQDVHRYAGALALQLLVYAALYENLVLAVGSLVGEGDLLERLNRITLFLQAILAPFLMVAALEFARRGGVKWAGGRLIPLVIWLSALSLAGFGAMAAFLASSELRLETFAGVRWYAPVNPLPPVPEALTALVILVFGLLLWRPIRWPWMGVAGVVMLVGLAIPAELAGPFAGSTAELLLLALFVATVNRLVNPEFSISEGELDSRLGRVQVKKE